MGDFLPLPDIGADLDRVPVGSTESPTSTPSSNNEPTLLPSPLPTTLAPVTQAPSSLAPSSLAPTSSSPITPSPTTLSPVTPSPTTSEPSLSPTTLSPTSLSPTTSSPTLIIGCPKDAKICPDGSVVSREGPDCTFPECPPTETRTVYSCPPPKPQTITTQNENGTDVILIIEPSISTIRITYGFQMIISDEEELEDLLPEFENQLESSLGEYYTSNTEVGQGEDGCGGYIIEDFRRQQRRLLGMKKQRRRARAEDVVEQEKTKIIGISTAQDLAIAEDEECVPQNTDNCHVIIGSVDATYVGTNEAGVTSSISRAVKQEVDDNNSNPGTSEIVVQYLGTQDDTSEGGGFTLADTLAMAKNVASNWQEAMPERTGNEQLTPLGMGIMIALGSAFAMVVLVLFFKSDDKSSSAKKKSKKEALVEYDDERQTDEGQSYCYDLESAATAQGGAEHAINMRGGTLNNDSTGNNNDPGLNTPAPAPAPTYATVASVTQTGGNNNQTPQTSLAAAAASNQQQQTDRLRQLLEATLTTQQKAVLDTLGVEQRAVLDDVMALSLSNTFNQGAPPVNPYTTATPGGNNNNNTTQLIQQVNNPSGDDGTGDENMEDSGNNNNGGGGNNNIGGGNRNLIYTSELFHYEQMGFIRRTLLATIKGSIVNPIDLYNEQDKLAKKASHLTNVAHKQTLTDVADKTAEALEEEAAVDPKLVKVMILDGAETAVKKLMQQNNNNNNNNSKNKNGGGNDTTASTKNQSPHQSNRPRSPSPGRGNGGRGNRGRGRGSAGRGTGGGRGKNGKQSSKKSSRKSNDVKTRGRSKSPGTSRKK